MRHADAPRARARRVGPAHLLTAAVLLSALAAGGCDCRRPVSEPAPVADAPRVVAPAVPAVRRYGETAPPAPADPLVAALDAVVRGETDHRGGRTVRPDPALSAAAITLARAGPGRVDPVGIELAMSHHGVFTPVPALLSIDARGMGVDALAEAARPRLREMLARGRYNRFGVGRATEGAETRVVVALAELDITLEPIPRHLPADGRTRVRGSVSSGLEAPRVIATLADGQARRLETDVLGGRHFEATFACAGAGRHRIEVMADGPDGPRVVANFPVWCGAEPPTRHQVVLEDVDAAPRSEGDSEQRLFERLQAARAEHGLDPLVWDESAAEVARAHSLDMRDHEFVAHVSPNTGTVSDRMESHGIRARRVLENVALAGSPDAAHDGLMESPGHRGAILSADVTRVGVGVAFGEVADDGRVEIYATQVFIEPAAPIDAARAAERIRRLVGAAAVRDRDLERIAAALARDYADGRVAPERVAEGAAAAVSETGGDTLTGRTLRAIVTRGDDPADADAIDRALDRLGDPRYGLGVVVGWEAASDARTHFAVLLFAGRAER